VSHKILVVDDDDALREMVGLVLSGAGYQPSFAADGLSAITAFNTHAPDLVLLDIMLPGQSGIEVCEQIRAKYEVQHDGGQQKRQSSRVDVSLAGDPG
jgi:two-component system response regulator MtrA